jgi:AcrR family transcriptional regulator
LAKKTHKSPEQARDAILDAAEQIVVQVGPAGLRISAVAKKAGMAHPNIIHHFGSREGLLNSLANRMGERATHRITEAIKTAVDAPAQGKAAAMTQVLDTAYPGDEGRAAVWMHLSGAESSLKENMQQIVELSHQLRKTVSEDADLEHTNRLVMLVTLALVGEVVSGQGIKEALGFAEDNRAHFRAWLAEILLNLPDDQLCTSLDIHPLHIPKP